MNNIFIIHKTVVYGFFWIILLNYLLMKIISFHDGFNAIRQQLKDLNSKIESSDMLDNIDGAGKKEFLNSVILESLNESEREKEQILNSLVEQVCYLDLDYNIKWLNTAGLKSISPDVSITEIIGQPCYKVWHGKNKPCAVCPVSTTLRTGWPWKEEITFDDGITKLVSAQPVLDESGNPKGVIQIELDITMRKEAEKALERSQKRSRALLDAIPDLFIIFNDSGNFIDYHPSADLQILAIKDKPEGKHLTKLLPEAIAVEILKHAETLSDVGSFRVFEYPASPDNPDIYYECRLIRIDQNENVCIFRDISNQKSRERQILQKSFHDQLTGLYNRAYFDEELNRIEQSRQSLPTSILIIDVNCLKLTNDAFGHHYGDKLLKAVADILSSNCRKSDVIARTGGDEFSIILPNSPISKAEKLSERIINACRNSSYDDIFARPSVSIGCAERSDGSVDLQDIIKLADERMYKMKLEYRSQHLETLINDIINSMKKQGFENEEHLDRLVSLTERFSRFLNLSSEEIVKIKQLAKLHDIGNIRVSDKILSSSGALSSEQYAEIKQHPIIGFRIARAIPDYSYIADLILYHHERWDGAGYPSGLKEREIPLLSRIFALTDSFDLITNGTKYHGAVSGDSALDEIRRNSGTQFDPDLSEKFISFLREETA